MGLYLMAASSALLDPAAYINGLQVALGVGFVIFVHEMGHFLVAKACGVKCEKFYIGFDVPIWKFPRTLGKFTWGETEYGIGIVPLGGYVKMLGQHDDPREAEAEAERTKNASDGTLDPRSYTAKTVPQRMAIISAGVIMNVIFAVIFAAIAFRWGVPYEPCIVAGTIPGDPAWLAEVPLGGQILQIHKDGKPSNHLRYEKDLVTNVVLSKDKALDILVEAPDGDQQWYSLTPSRRLISRAKDRVTIGVFLPKNLKIRGNPASMKAQSRRIPNLDELQSGDQIVAVNGETISSALELEALMARNISQPLNLTMERTTRTAQGAEEKSVFEYALPASRMRWTGMIMKMTPVFGVQPNSPAGKAGIQAGDVLVSIDGEPAGDPITLPQRIADRVDREIVVEVLRPDTAGEPKPMRFTVTPRAPRTTNHFDTPNSSIGLDTLGIAYRVENVVAEVAPDTPAAQAGILPGDEVRSVAFRAAGPEQLAEEQSLLPKFLEPVPLMANESDWPWIHDSLQFLLPDSSVQLTVSRQGTTKEFTVAMAASPWWNEERFLPLEPVSRVHQAESWAEALPLGLRETKEQLMGIVRFLKSLVSGRISFTNLGGPGTIAKAAFAEASRGPTRLLIFLTFLSANLAVLNILPIPALDGGHLVFLAWEGLFRRPPNPSVQGWLTLVGVAFLLLLMIVVIGLDVSRF